MSDIQKWFIGASIEDALDIGEYAQDIQEEYLRFLRIRGLQPIEPERSPEAIRIALLDELAKLDTIPIREQEEPQIDIDTYLANFTAEESDELDRKIALVSAYRTEEHQQNLDFIQSQTGE